MPSAAFTSLVDLCRISRAPRVAGTDLIMGVTSSAQSVALLGAIEADDWAYTLTVDGAETTQPLGRFPEGTMVQLAVHGMAREQQVVANNVGTLLRFNQGMFLGSLPGEFYLIDEKHASWEESIHPDVQAYGRALKALDWVRRLADVVRERDGTAGEAVILATRKLTIPLVYDSSVLSSVSSMENIEGLETATFNEHHRDARRDIAKRVLVRFFDSVPELERFSALLKRLAEVRQAFLADFDVYASGFSFDKAREEFERKKLDFVVKTNAASADAMNKLIAIPVGQGLLASQMKREASLELLNISLLAGSIVFAVIAVILLVTQINTLLQIREELLAEKKLLIERAAPTYDRLKGMISTLERRLKLHIYWVPAGLGLLLLVTTATTAIVFAKLTATVAP